ncbi:hypothetical protein KFL_008910020 [Klebsormidium nitens]|uniref:GAG-pre-integrase domain-containing protein n=1 Tax=Klebsormidium nitens TaxID=105231 RepID=A0A1Y1IUP1_KLENI|nr:hypothetical protein KFL_008910020 [Klebsormidium nitens]|eukprot:GAQ91958.1 hypothetical protein KFL_008910020 [Klebsormidium nitens]
MSIVCQPKATWEDTCLLVREAETPVLWYRRLGHAGYERLAKMVDLKHRSGCGDGLGWGVGQRGYDGPPRQESLDDATDHGGALSRTKRFGGAIEPDARGKGAGFATNARLDPELSAEAMVTANYTRDGSGSEEIGLPVEGDGDTEDLTKDEMADRRYPTRARRASKEWYRAITAAESGEHPKGSGEHSELPTYQKAIGGRRERALTEVDGRGDAILVGERDVGASQKTGEGEADSHEVGLQI